MRMTRTLASARMHHELTSHGRFLGDDAPWATASVNPFVETDTPPLPRVVYVRTAFEAPSLRPNGRQHTSSKGDRSSIGLVHELMAQNPM